MSVIYFDIISSLIVNQIRNKRIFKFSFLTFRFKHQMFFFYKRGFIDEFSGRKLISLMENYNEKYFTLKLGTQQNFKLH